MYDHAKRGKRYCPLMREFCTKGWTPAMGLNPDGFPIEGACAAWQPVTTFNIKEGKNEEIFDCSVFGWGPDLLVTIAQEVSHGTASTDKIATQVQRQRSEFIGALPQDAKDRLVKGEIRLLDNGNGNGQNH